MYKSELHNKKPLPSLMNDFIYKIPKAELHIHLEGSIEPEHMFEIAERNRITLPYSSPEELRNAYKFSNLQSFLNVYYKGMDVLLHERDFYDITKAYFTRIHAQNVRHTELFFDPQSHTGRGISFETVVSGIYQAMLDAKRQLNISSKLILCFQRCFNIESAFRTLQQAAAFKKWIVGVGLDSSEIGHPPATFAPVFEKAQELGFLTVAHAGEEGPPEYIWQALEKLCVLRIDHGVRCIEDPRLIKKLATEQIPLTVCPLSNVKLRIFNTLQDHNLKQLLDTGLCVTVNSDDPAYFGGYITDNFIAVKDALHLTEQDICHLTKNSFQASFITDEEKRILIDELENFISRYNITQKQKTA